MLKMKLIDAIINDRDFQELLKNKKQI